jgi:hypothetical protein
MNWFRRLTGFDETTYEETRCRMQIDGRCLRSLINDQIYDVGELEIVSLQALRERVQSAGGLRGRLRARVMTGDVRHLHQSPEYVGALFQVASQFNFLEMTSPDVTPEHGVTRYENDKTQGPACAIAAGAATIYRNYFAPVGDEFGQTNNRQLNGLADLGAALGDALSQPVDMLWTMRNGYALCTAPGLDAITKLLDSSASEDVAILQGKLQIGVHRNVEVTDSDDSPRPFVSQAFCSALPVAYSRVPSIHWRSFASLVLESAYEATMWAALENAQRGRSNLVLLTSLGGGAFGNHPEWIHAAIRKALMLAAPFNLDVRLISRGSPSGELIKIVEDFE